MLTAVADLYQIRELSNIWWARSNNDLHERTTRKRAIKNWAITNTRHNPTLRKPRKSIWSKDTRIQHYADHGKICEQEMSDSQHRADYAEINEQEISDCQYCADYKKYVIKRCANTTLCGLWKSMWSRNKRSPTLHEQREIMIASAREVAREWTINKKYIPWWLANA
jgi:hypothetical protein